MEDDCVFCKIVKGTVPASKVYEDDKFLAFLDIRPYTRGHTLVVPKTHYRWVYDVPEFGKYFEVAKRLAEAQKLAYNADWVTLLTLGMQVPHAHIHVIPRRNNESGGESFENLRYTYTNDELTDAANELKAKVQ